MLRLEISMAGMMVIVISKQENLLYFPLKILQLNLFHIWQKPGKNLLPNAFSDSKTGEGDRLLVIKHCVFTISNFFTFNDLRNGKLDVFCKEMVNPTSIVFNQISLYQKSCPRNGTTRY